MNNDQKLTISLAQWCAYLPYGIDIFLDTKGCLRGKCKVSIDNFHLVVATPLYKPLLRPVNKDSEADINEIIATVSDSIRYGYAAFYDTDEEFDPIDVYSYYTYFGYEKLPYNVVQALLAAHYDIFNLIGQGLALPIE